MFFADIHSHILSSVDDGAKTVEEMYSMVDAAYEQGTRFICATPHFYPEFFGDNGEKAESAFLQLENYCNSQYSDLRVCLGNEIFYHKGILMWLKEGLCRSLGNTNYVLLEFDNDSSEQVFMDAAKCLLNFGYVPIFAHAERYRKLGFSRLAELRRMGVLVQVNCDSLFGGFFEKARSRLLISKGLVDFLSSDSHDLQYRTPNMKKAYDFLDIKYGKEMADDLCYNNAMELFEPFGGKI